MITHLDDSTKRDIYQAFVDRRPLQGPMLGVRTTGIFCRTGCPARLPLFKNCEFFDGVEAALKAGYRACKRCHPMGDDPALIQQLITLVETAEDGRVDEAMLNAHNIDPATARRQFKAKLGLSFSDYARLRRLGLAARAMARGSSVIDAQLEAGFESASGFRAAYAKTFGRAPAKGLPQPLFIDWLDTPMGRMVIVADDERLYLIEFTDRVKLPRQFERLQRRHRRAIVPGKSAMSARAAEQMQAYFAGTLKSFSLPIATSGTAFQNGVWEALQTIPYGQTWSYADLAARIGNEKAVRAVASANGANGLAVVIPCHRVIGKDGGLGGYAGGLPRKQQLLDLEQGVGRLKL